jgi:hypothetical protein
MFADETEVFVNVEEEARFLLCLYFKSGRALRGRKPDAGDNPGGSNTTAGKARHAVAICYNRRRALPRAASPGNPAINDGLAISKSFDLGV